MKKKEGIELKDKDEIEWKERMKKIKNERRLPLSLRSSIEGNIPNKKGRSIDKCFYKNYPN